MSSFEDLPQPAADPDLPGPGAVGLVLIGRNEGARLVRALEAATGQANRIVYVDSGSRDGSVTAARAAGVAVVELDPACPFNAARGRNAGYAELMQGDERPEFVQFIDGDCQLEPGWIERAVAHLHTGPGLGLVTGWRSEVAPEASIYNRICDHEWHRPAGPITTCGGDMMVRATAFEQVGGFDETVIAAEDDEFCLRLAGKGWRLERLPSPMTRHDAGMTRFSEWWRRAERAGHGFAQVGRMHPGHFRAERRRVIVFGLLLPLLALSGIWFAPALLLASALYALSFLRAWQGLRRDGLPVVEAAHQALFLVASKFPNLVGMIRYAAHRLRRHAPRIIEYQ
ncbi:glycosyltransferase [Cribrihabitans marinus]|uniref:glycosyltransferase n=1 Tax=Cribrihabitans marinus TaxID=1227549 RepID=UPI0035716615